MKSIIRTALTNSFAIWATSQIITGLVIKDGLGTVLIAGVVLTIMNIIVKPIVSLIALPITLLTLGLFGWVIHIFLLYLLTVFVPQISIQNYVFPGIHVGLLTIGKMNLSGFQTALAAAFVLSFIQQGVRWLFER